MVVCAGIPNSASMVTVYAPAWTTVVVRVPHNKLRVTIHAPAWTKVVVCVGTPSITICDVSPPYAGFSSIAMLRTGT